MTRLAGAAIGAVALVLTACGAGDSAGDAVTRFHESLAAGDFETFCTVLDPELVATLEESAGGQPCATTMEQNATSLFGDVDADAKVTLVDVAKDGDTATVTFTVGDEPEQQMSLKKVDGEWKVNVL